MTITVPFQIKEILREVSGEEIDVIFVRDGDGLPDEWRQRIIEYASKKGIQLIILERFEIESYLLEPSIILKTLRRKYNEAELPTEETITEKIVEVLKNTYVLAKYNYNDCLEEELYQVALLINDDDYRNPQRVKTEVREIVRKYENDESLEKLLRIGMGKEALKQIRIWLNEEYKFNISNRDLLKDITEHDLPEEIPNLLELLQSKESRENPEGFEELVIESLEEEEIIDIEQVVPEQQQSLF